MLSCYFRAVFEPECHTAITVNRHLVGYGKPQLFVKLGDGERDWDLPKLSELLKALDDDLKDITGFDAKEIDELLGIKRKSSGGWL